MSTADPSLAVASEVGAAPAPANQVTDGLRRLRAWITALGSPADDPAQRIRDEFQRSALSATLRRFAYFGVESSLNRYTARELLQFQLMVAGSFSTFLARVTWTRALVEDDGPVLQALADSALVDQQVAWSTDLPADETGLAGEELHVARLLWCRRDPARFSSDWLWAIPDDMPRLGAALALAALAAGPRYAQSISEWLQRRPDALASMEPDDLLGALVSASSAHPQAVLGPFAGWYGEATVAAAAEWHLEHGEPRAALELCSSIRPLGPQIERARLIAGLASLELDDAAQATDLLAAMAPGTTADVLRLRLAERAPTAVPDDQLAEIARRSPVDRPQAFFTAVRLLIGRRRVDEARALCRERGADFGDQPEIRALIGALGAGSRA